jgi:2-polyprenyl-6-methoxyphenol hydroxylase-like FAD-dependent oxidoreductase
MDAWSCGRTVLVGDACSCPSLFAGEGASLAMAGAYVLAGELAKARGDHQVAFSAYEALLRPVIARTQHMAERFAGWFAPRTRLGLLLRNQATRVLSVPVLGTWMARRMFADPFHLPAYGDAPAEPPR